MAGYNRQIREALEDGSFVNNIKTTMASRRNEIENISLWGAEPTINAKFFKEFIYELNNDAKSNMAKIAVLKKTVDDYPEIELTLDDTSITIIYNEEFTCDQSITSY